MEGGGELGIVGYPHALVLYNLMTSNVIPGFPINTKSYFQVTEKQELYGRCDRYDHFSSSR